MLSCERSGRWWAHDKCTLLLLIIMCPPVHTYSGKISRQQWLFWRIVHCDDDDNPSPQEPWPWVSIFWREYRNPLTLLQRTSPSPFRQRTLPSPFFSDRHRHPSSANVAVTLLQWSSPSTFFRQRTSPSPFFSERYCHPSSANVTQHV